MNQTEYIPLSSSPFLNPPSISSVTRTRPKNTFLKLTSRPLSRSNSNSSSIRSISPTPTELDNDDHERRGFLPSYNNSSGRGRNGPSLLNSSGKIWSRVRGGRIRWLTLLTALVLVVLFWSTGKGGVVEKVRENGLKSGKNQVEETLKQHELESHPHPPDLLPSSNTIDTALSTIISTSPIDINAQPSSLLEPKLPLLPQEKFLAYSPHSGYHNQRISLENALTLSHILNRTLLLPPVWLGQAIPYISFDKLQRRIQIATKIGLERCKEFAEGGSEDIIPRECEGYFDWTIVGWEFLINLEAVKEKVRIRNRWNMTREWLEEELDLSNLNSSEMNSDLKAQEKDTFYLKDSFMYEYRFYDSAEDLEPLAKFAKRRDIEMLKEFTSDYRLLHLGSLFGTSRIRTTKESNFDARSFFRRGMVFKNSVVDEIVDVIKDRLGGSGNYRGLHLRVGDGIFQHEARKNMAAIWLKLCVDKMKMDPKICDEFTNKKYIKRADLVNNTTKRASNSRPQREGAYNHAPLPPLPTVIDHDSSLLHSSLSCRSSFHTSPNLLPFNIPLFIATDSKSPSTDPKLSTFFNAFPCTFILNDFSSTSLINSEKVEGLDRLSRLRNSQDLTPLAQFLYPQLDAQIAAHGIGLVGTPQSTYSRFAVDVLHQVYHGWEIIERG